MTAAALPADGAPGGRLALWASAAVAAAALHAVLAAWALRSPPPQPAEAPAPAAVLIDLAPATVAPRASAPQVSPDAIDQLEVPEPPPDLALLPPEIEPLPDVPRPDLPEPPVAEPPPVESAAAVLPAPRPRARPATLPRREEAPREDPVREKPREQKLRAAAAAPPAAAPAAASTPGRGATASPANWRSKLIAHLERRKRYPAAARGRREEGVVQVSFAIDAVGNVLSARVSRSSGHAALDAEVLALVRRASPVPAPPPGAPRQITAPVQFRIR